MSTVSNRSRALAPRNYYSPLGNQLIKSGFIQPEQMRKALELKSSGRPMVKILEEVTGAPLPPQVLRQYKKHQLFELKILYGVDSIDPEINPIANNKMAELIDTLIPIDVCRRYKLIPLNQSEPSPSAPAALLVAMVDPDNLEAYDDLMRILGPRGLKLQRMVIAEDDYETLLEQYFGEHEERVKEQEKQEKEEKLQKLVDLSGLEGFDAEISDVAEEIDDDLNAFKDAQGSPIIKAVNSFLVKAIKEGASDIHIEPQEEYLRVRFRKDGVLTQAFDPLPKKITAAVVARIKIMADLDIAERRLPQDGKIRRMLDGRKIDFRVSTLPSRYGEKVVMRLLDNSSTQLGLDKLITDQPTLAEVRNVANRPFGVILVTGPTGSGKSTTLYSILAERNKPGVNISTAEDPIEYSLHGITQVQVLREKGMDFASILRAFLRQDPDILLVGETRDRETAKTAVEAALTGHLVLTTLHTNDAAGAIARLDEMGVEPFMISGALLGVLAQRLMRRVCQECRVPYNPTQDELARFGLSAANEDDIVLYQANTLSPEEIAAAKKEQTLCEECNGTGYKGRVGVYEFMANSERLQELIIRGAPTEHIKEVAIEEGMTTLLAYSLNLVQEGLTTLEEVERVTFTDSGLEAELRAKRKSSLTCHTCLADLQQDWLDCPYCLTPRFQT